jgi:hypothetical protein
VSNTKKKKRDAALMTLHSDQSFKIMCRKPIRFEMSQSTMHKSQEANYQVSDSGKSSSGKN